MQKIFGSFTAALLILGVVSLSGCNTIGGAGKDIQKGGEAIEKCADGTAKPCKR